MFCIYSLFIITVLLITFNYGICCYCWLLCNDVKSQDVPLCLGYIFSHTYMLLSTCDVIIMLLLCMLWLWLWCLWRYAVKGCGWLLLWRCGFLWMECSNGVANPVTLIVVTLWHYDEYCYVGLCLWCKLYYKPGLWLALYMALQLWRCSSSHMWRQDCGWLWLWLAMAMDGWPGAVTVSLARHICDGNPVTVGLWRARAVTLWRAVAEALQLWRYVPSQLWRS